MTDDKKMLRVIINGQSAMKQELLGEIKKSKTELKKEINKNAILISKNTKLINKNGERIDKIGLQVAWLEDDAPTIKEFDSLEKRVGKLEKNFVS